MSSVTYVSAPVSLGGNVWSSWYSSGGIFTSDEGFGVTLDFSLTGVSFPPSSVMGGSAGQYPFWVEVRYFNGSNFVTEQYSFGLGGGSVELEIGADSLSTVKFRLAGQGGIGSQEIRVDTDIVEFEPDSNYDEITNELVFPLDGNGNEPDDADYWRLTEGGAVNESFSEEIDVLLLAEASNTESVVLSGGGVYWPSGGNNLGAYQALSEAVKSGLEELEDQQGVAGNWIGDGLANLWEQIQTFGSPLVLDLDGDGIELSSLANANIYWDIDEDGFAEQSGWVTGDDGFLAIDLNGDGIVTDHTELFGSTIQDGFTALSVYDTNSDGVIDANDAQFGDLIIWVDANADAISEESEIYTLADLNIVSIDLNASTPNNMYIEGNHISHVSSYTVDDGVSGAQTFDIVDVWFEYNNTNTSYVGDYTLDLASLFVTTIRGYGDIPDMHIAASMDNNTADPDSLLSLLQSFTALDFEQIFSDDGSVQDMVQTIMFRWAGVDDVDPTSRGQWVDARQLEFMEKLMGDDYLQGGTTSNPGPHASDGVRMVFDFALNAISGKLIGQAAGAALFNDGVYYNPATDAFEGFTEFNQDTLDSLLAMSMDGAKVSDKTAFWSGVIGTIDQSVGIDNLPTQEKADLDAMLFASDPSLTVDLVLAKIQHDVDANLSWSPDGETITGTSGDDVYGGSVGDDLVHGGYGNDTLIGGLGDDLFYGGSNDDILNGQLGDDYLQGEAGNDTYLLGAGHGHDTILDTSGADKILFDTTVEASDLTFTRNGSFDVDVAINSDDGVGLITISGQIKSAGGTVEVIQFADGSTLDQSQIDFELHGTSGNDALMGVGVGYGGSGNDTIYGYDGDDNISGHAAYGGYSYTTQNYLYGGNGNDTINGDHGNDELYGDDGNDILDGNAGDDLLVGGLGDDVLKGEAGADTYIFEYGDGSDTITELYGDASVDRLSFGAGITQEMISIERSGARDLLITIDGGLGGQILLDDQINYSAYYVIEEFAFADGTVINNFDEYILHGNESAETLRGASIGGGGIDIIHGLGGNDKLYAYYGTYGYNDNYLYGGDGDDYLYGEYGTDYLDGGEGSDRLYGYLGNDTLSGGNGNDYLYGAQGDDFLDGGAGNDFLYGAAGNDIYHMGLGNDYVEDIGGGDDTFIYTGGMDAIYQRDGGNDTLVLDIDTTINDISIAQSGNHYDLVIDAGVNEVQLQWFFYNGNYPTEIIEFQDGFTTSLVDFPSWISGTASADTLDGTANADTLIGKDGDDVVSGLAGNDNIHGGAGNDTLYGGDGLDNLWGGDDADTFIFESASAFNNVDVIGDFKLSENDVIDISDLLSGYDPINDAISDFVQITDDGTHSTLAVDADGGADGFVTIATLYNATALTDENALVTSGNLIAA